MRLEDAIAQDYKLTGNGEPWYKTEEHDSLVIDTERQKFWWNSRGLYGDVITWFVKVKGFDPKTAYELVKSNTFVTYPVEAYLNSHKEEIPFPALVDSFYKYGLDHTDYWTNKRGYTQQTIDRFKLGYTGEYHVIPIYEHGRFVNFQCRKDDPKRVRHWYRGVAPHSFNFSILGFTDEIYLTEGPVDAIMLRQNGLPSASQTAGANNIGPYVKDFSMFNGVKHIYIVYDNDTAGMNGAVQLGKLFGARALIYCFQEYSKGYDITDYFKEGHTKEEFETLVKEKALPYYYFEDKSERNYS